MSRSESILITGVAGFIGFHLAKRLLEQGRRVLGIDNLNAYYDVGLKQARLSILCSHRHFTFEILDVVFEEALSNFLAPFPPLAAVVHLAGQAGVRHSLDQPFSYVESNIRGPVALLEVIRKRKEFCPIVYASSSSVYGAATKLPLAVTDSTDEPLSLYAATKKANELIMHAYAHLYRLPTVGLRFFTVYGPWGRPDMAPHIFTRAVLTGEKVGLFGHGALSRDFTYIDDIITGIIAAIANPPQDDNVHTPHCVYNLGNGRPVLVRDFLGAIENACERKAVIELLPMKKGDVPHTFADIDTATTALGYVPATTVSEGVSSFVAWFRKYYRL